MTDLPEGLPLLDWDAGTVVVEPPEGRPGAWAGGPSALVVDGVHYLAYRMRRPVGEGRGYANVLARSADGVRFETVAVVEKDAFGAESLERPAVVVTPEGRWRMYVSAAIPGTRGWRVDLLEAATPEGLATAAPRTVLPCTGQAAPKDPVIVHHDGRWHLWASVHPLDDPSATDRMTTEHATSLDGVDWQWQGTALAGRPGLWDARGVRLSAVLVDGDRLLAYYDGRATPGQNWEEQTGVAVGSLPAGTFTALGEEPVLVSPHAPGGLRYVTVVPVAEGWRAYYEATRADGAHELRTELVRRVAAAA
ncbi:hypothetical protein [Motilibacter deserti]|uniref:hypothetical protein n=1 Tax=Motilibacter deserti TaxID=2714956 RepID=UPI002F2B7C55